jgi:hypothetical protein
MPNIETILRDHVTLQIECIDRLYLNGYQPRLQCEGGLVHFLLRDPENRVPSPALLGQMTARFVAAIERFAEEHFVPIVRFEKGQDKEDIANEYLARFRQPEGVVFIGVAQEKVGAFRCHEKKRPGRRPWFHFYRASAFVNQYYFYILDRNFGLCFIKFSSYAPFAVRVWLNGHEWAKRQLDRAGIVYESLDNGFLSVGDSERAQQICDRLDAFAVESFFEKWLGRLPHPLTREERAANYRYSLSILQLEMSRTEVFDRPLAGRQFFEEVIRENLDLGRPNRVQLIFGRRITKKTPGTFRTRVLTTGVEPALRVDYKRTTIKQYFKLGRALRTETTFNDTRDFGINKNLLNLDRLRAIGRHANRRLLHVQRLSHNCAVASNTFERVVLPTVHDDGSRAPGLRFGDPRVMALFSGLASQAHQPDGFSNAMLRERVAALHDKTLVEYGRPRMTYDLRRLRLKGLIHRIPGRHRYVLTPLGRRVALFFSKAYVRVLRGGLSRLDAPPAQTATDPLVKAWNRLDRVLDEVVAEAKLIA